MRKSTVKDIFKKYWAGLGFHDMPWSRRPQNTIIQVDRLVKRKSTDGPRKTANDIAQESREENVTDVSYVAVSKRLHDVRLFSRVAVKKPFISKEWKKIKIKIK